MFSASPADTEQTVYGGDVIVSSGVMSKGRIPAAFSSSLMDCFKARAASDDSRSDLAIRGITLVKADNLFMKSRSAGFISKSILSA